MALEVVAPSHFAFIQCKIGGFENTALTILVLGGLILQLKAFKIVN